MLEREKYGMKIFLFFKLYDLMSNCYFFVNELREFSYINIMFLSW